MSRKDHRGNSELRSISIKKDINIHAEGSVEVSFGNTKVICNASIENNVPRWMKNHDNGWVTQNMECFQGQPMKEWEEKQLEEKQSGRTQEIQRLIGRSLRQSVNLKYLKGKTIHVDCDVIQADGGTRTASITGGCVALFQAIKNHHDDQRAIRSYVAAVSLGVLNNQVILDLDYKEDSKAETDLNLVMTEDGGIIEIQGTGEEAPFSIDQLNEIITIGSDAISDIIEIQKACLK